MVCTDSCVRPTPSQAHCSVCHLTFTGIRAFDIHRHQGVCLKPFINNQMSERNGVWGFRNTMPPEVRARLRRLDNR